MTPASPSLVAPLQGATPESRESAGKNVRALLSEVDFEDFLRASLYEVAGSHVQERQKAAGARISGCHPETVGRWIGGMTTPKAVDFWPVAFMALLARFDDPTQQMICAEIRAMCGVDE